MLEAMLRLAIEHPSPQVRGEVVQALADHADRPPVRDAILRIAARDPDPGVRSEAADVVEDLEDGE